MSPNKSNCKEKPPTLSSHYNGDRLVVQSALGDLRAYTNTHRALSITYGVSVSVIKGSKGSLQSRSSELSQPSRLCSPFLSFPTPGFGLALRSRSRSLLVLTFLRLSRNNSCLCSHDHNSQRLSVLPLECFLRVPIRVRRYIFSISFTEYLSRMERLIRSTDIARQLCISLLQRIGMRAGKGTFITTLSCFNFHSPSGSKRTSNSEYSD